MDRPLRNIALLVPAVALLVGSPAAHAQSNAAIAEQLFLSGQKLMDAGHVPEACGKFADSQRLDPAIGTLMHLAACHEKMGKLAAAWGEFTDVEAQAHKAGQAEREKYAREHATALDAKLPKVIIELAHPPEGTTITLDGTALPLGVLGTELPIDPGDHSLQVLAPGMKPWRQAKLNLGPSAVVTRVQVNLDEEAAQGASPGGPSSNAGPATPPASEQGGAWNPTTKRVVGYSASGLGAASLAIAVVEEITSAGRKSDENKYPAWDTRDRQTVADQASAAQTYAIIFGAAGVAAIGAGVYLIVTARDQTPPPSGSLRVTPIVGYRLAGAGLHLDW